MNPDTEKLLNQAPGAKKATTTRQAVSTSASFSGKLEGKQHRLWFPKCQQSQQEVSRRLLTTDA